MADVHFLSVKLVSDLFNLSGEHTEYLLKTPLSYALSYPHSCVEGTVCYDSDEAAAFSISSLSNRSSPLSWRQGQASPRLQAGDAPSTGNAQSEVPLRINHTSRVHLIEALDDSDPSLLKGDYLSNNNLGGKSPNEEDEDDDDDDIDDLGNG